MFVLEYRKDVLRSQFGFKSDNEQSREVMKKKHEFQV